jgi:phage-related protein
MEEERESKPLVWLNGEIKTPPFSESARIEAGFLLRQVQDGVKPGLPHSRPMPGICSTCHELRIPDENRNWRIVYRIDSIAILVVAVFPKTTQATPKYNIDNCKRILKAYGAAVSKSRQEK